MFKQLVICAAGLTGGLLLTGCSATGAAITAFNIGENVSRNRLDVRIWIDGSQAERNEIKQAAAGYSRWKCSGDIGTCPKVKFEYKKPDALGRIRSVTMQIHQKHESKYSDQAEFVIVSRSNAPEAQMKPGVVYDLGNLGSDHKVMNWKGEEVSGVQLTPGWQYMLVFTVSADDSETAQIYFETKKATGTPKTAFSPINEQSEATGAL